MVTAKLRSPVPTAPDGETPQSQSLLQLYDLRPDDHYINLLIYGEQGIGKTYLTGTILECAEMLPALIVSHEGGLLTISHLPPDKFQAVDVKNVAQLVELHNRLMAGDQDPIFGKFKTIIVDSATELQAMVLDHVVQEAVSKNSKRDDIDDIWVDDYGTMTSKMKRMFRAWRDMPRNLIMTALVSTDKDRATQRVTEVRPGLTAGLCRSVMGYVDFVWYLYQHEGTRFVLTRATGLFKAKTRGVPFSEALGQSYPNPNLTEIYRLMQRTMRDGEQVLPPSQEESLPEIPREEETEPVTTEGESK